MWGELNRDNGRRPGTLFRFKNVAPDSSGPTPAILVIKPCRYMKKGVETKR